MVEVGLGKSREVWKSLGKSSFLELLQKVSEKFLFDHKPARLAIGSSAGQPASTQWSYRKIAADQ
jgi:hypothetical protein